MDKEIAKVSDGGMVSAMFETDTSCNISDHSVSNSYNNICTKKGFGSGAGSGDGRTRDPRSASEGDGYGNGRGTQYGQWP